MIHCQLLPVMDVVVNKFNCNWFGIETHINRHVKVNLFVGLQKQVT